MCGFNSRLDVRQVLVKSCGPVLAVRHIEGATYRDLWHGVDLEPRVEAGRAVLSVKLDPRGIGCVMRRLP